MSPDFTNGLFELFASLFVILNIRAVLKDRSVKGVSWIAVAFFTLWSAWNVWFYPIQNLMYSFYGGILVCITNFIYLYLLIKYKNNE